MYKIICVYRYRLNGSQYVQLSPMLEKEKLAANSGNYADWIHNPRFILKSAKKEYILDQPLGDAPSKDSSPEEVAAYTSHSDDYEAV